MLSEKTDPPSRKAGFILEKGFLVKHRLLNAAAR